MISELGHYLLSLAFCLSVAQCLLAGLGLRPRWRSLSVYSEGVSLAAAAAVILSFLMLLVAFVRSDFSLANVAAHSHTAKPLIYKISAAWGSHEGSMLLWNMILLSFGAMVTLFGRSIPVSLKHKTLGIQGLLGAAFTGFTLFSSNPLARLEVPAFQGDSLTPALQDPALAFHPPLLYVGYVGFSVVFSFAVAALIEGRIDKVWARLVRPWILMAWSCLTIGIFLGAFWAYYQLGWGGWWAWDPVENASFMPWLAATALLHSVIVMEKRDSLKAWTVFLALLTFTFSMMGAFLVRSGVLTSVHAFAVDPKRGIILLGILFVVAGLAFTLFALRAPNLQSGQAFGAVSREGALVLNNLLIAAALASVVLGTLYPIVVQALFDQTMSVGAPYFIMVFAPIMGLAMVLLPIATFLAWKQAQLKAALQQLMVAAFTAIVLAGIGWMLFKGQDGSLKLGLYMGLALGLFVIGGTLVWLNERTGLTRLGDIGQAWTRLLSLPAPQQAMWLAHLGLGVFVLGAVVENHARQMQMQPMAVGEVMQMGTYRMQFDGLYRFEGPNYDAQGGNFTIRDQAGKIVCHAHPQRRFYPDSAEIMGKVSLCFEPLNDFYVVLAEPQIGQDNVARWQVRLFKNTWIRLVFLGPLLMALAGFVAMFGFKARRIAAGKA